MKMSESNSKGGHINEKVLQGTCNSKGLGSLLHSVFGLDHYPDYLKRWKIEDIECLESKLEELQQKVRDQKEKLLHRITAMEGYKPTLVRPERIEDIFDPRFSKYIVDGKLQAGRATEILTEEREAEVYSFPILTPAFCEQLLDECHRAQIHLNGVISAPSSSCEDPFGNGSQGGFINCVSVLDWAHLDWVNDALLEYVVAPFAKILYPEESRGKNLDWRHGYIISYAPKEVHDGDCDKSASSKPAITRSHLISHTDDSEVTMSVCLGRKFTGGDVIFKNFRHPTSENHSSSISDNNEKYFGDVTVVTPKIGHAVLHRGRQVHAVDPVLSGERYMLILWTRNMTSFRSAICPCCWMNSRTDSARNCICGPSWN